MNNKNRLIAWFVQLLWKRGSKKPKASCYSYSPSPTKGIAAEITIRYGEPRQYQEVFQIIHEADSEPFIGQAPYELSAPIQVLKLMESKALQVYAEQEGLGRLRLKGTRAY
jgi:hypothetical protein